jgi:hypothetical protein
MRRRELIVFVLRFAGRAGTDRMGVGFVATRWPGVTKSIKFRLMLGRSLDKSFVVRLADRATPGVLTPSCGHSRDAAHQRVVLSIDAIAFCPLVNGTNRGTSPQSGNIATVGERQADR